MIRSYAILGLLLMAVPACDRAGEPEVETRSSTSALEQNLDLGAYLALSIHSEGGLLKGTVLPAPEFADPDRIMDVVHVQGSKETPVLDGVEDAKFLGDGSFVVISRQHELIRIQNGQSQVLATEVYGPLSVVGQRVAYLAGNAMPFFVPAVLDVQSGQRWEGSEDLIPSWSPVLSPDGRELIFASGKAGHSQLLRASIGTGLSIQNTIDIEAPPAGPNAPIWIHSDVLIFESEEGTLRYHLPTNTTTTLEGELPLMASDGRVFLHSDGGLREHREVKR